MKAIISLLSLSLILSNLVNAQTTRVIDNPHDLPVFAYANEVKPAYFDGIGTDQLYLVDTEGKRWKLYPRPNLYADKYPVVELTEEQIKESRHKHSLLCGAIDLIKNEGIDAYIRFLKADSSVVSVKRTEVNSVQIVFDDGDVEEMVVNHSSPSEASTKPRQSPQDRRMDNFQRALKLGRIIWFGTSTSLHRKGTPEKLQLMCEALAALRSGVELTEAQKTTPVSQKGVRHDALR